MKLIRIGILGAARIAPKAIIEPASYREDCMVVAVAARDAEKAAAYAKEHGINRSYGSYEELIADEGVELIYNALPPSRHADLSIAALQAGKHVLCEKPFCMNAGEAAKMVAAAKANDRFLLEAYHHRFHPAFVAMEYLVAQGRIGEVTRMLGTFYVPIKQSPNELRYRPELGGGALMDLGCYPLHAMRSVTRTEPRIVSATAEKADTGVDIYLDADLDFGGIPGRLECSMKPGRREADVHIYGTKGEIHYTNFVKPQDGYELKMITDAGERVWNDDQGVTYIHQLDHVVDVLTTVIPPRTGGEDSVNQMKAIDAIYAAAGMPRD